jgi:2-polyprenyl-3-methyl-5-hydroxy-6-metoxy-1,4-benzoquinol methylase
MKKENLNFIKSYSHKMTTTLTNFSSNISTNNSLFRERSHCICCDSKRLYPVWEGRFCDEPNQSFIKKCHYSEDVIKILGEEAFSLVSCKNCGATFHRRILRQEDLKILYSQWINNTQIEYMEALCKAGTKSEKEFEKGRQSIKHLLRLQKMLNLKATETIRLVDYGCGDGDFLGIAKLMGFDVYGIDFSSVRNERAAKMGITVFHDLETLKSHQIDKINVVTMFQVLEHLDNPLAVLKDIAKTMEDGGILIVEVPNCQGIKQPKNFSEFCSVHPLEHINAFTPITLQKICEKAGYVPIKRIPAHTTTNLIDIFKTEMGRFIQTSPTHQYFRLHKKK